MKKLLLLSNSTLHGHGYLEHAASEIRGFLGDACRSGACLSPMPWPIGTVTSGPFARHSGAFGYDVQGIHEADDTRAAVDDAQAIFVGGGNTFRLLDTLYSLGLTDAIRSRAEAGMPYMGASAGTNVACVTIKTTNDMPIVYPPSFDAIGLVPFNINPHYLDPDPDSKHKGETREQRIAEFHEVNDPPVLGLREGTWLRVEGESVLLAGSRPARLFRRGEEPAEFQSGSRLDFLLQ